MNRDVPPLTNLINIEGGGGGGKEEKATKRGGGIGSQLQQISGQRGRYEGGSVANISQMARPSVA